MCVPEAYDVMMQRSQRRLTLTLAPGILGFLIAAHYDQITMSGGQFESLYGTGICRLASRDSRDRQRSRVHGYIAVVC